MAQLTDGLFLHDILLMVLGSLLFLVLLGGLIARMARNEPVERRMQLFFVLPALMIAYPGTQRLAFSNGVLELEKRTEEVLQNPLDTSAVRYLDEQLNKVELRPVRSANALEATAKAQYVSGHPEAALVTSEKILRRNPENPAAAAVKKLVFLDKLETALSMNPTDTLAREKYLETIQALGESSEVWVQQEMSARSKLLQYPGR